MIKTTEVITYEYSKEGVLVKQTTVFTEEEITSPTTYKITMNVQEKNDRKTLVDNFRTVYEDYFSRGYTMKDSLIHACKQYNIYFCDTLYDIFTKDININYENIVGYYLKNVLNLTQYKNRTFKDSRF